MQTYAIFYANFYGQFLPRKAPLIMQKFQKIRSDPACRIALVRTAWLRFWLMVASSLMLILSGCGATETPVEPVAEQPTPAPTVSRSATEPPARPTTIPTKRPAPTATVFARPTPTEGATATITPDLAAMLQSPLPTPAGATVNWTLPETPLSQSSTVLDSLFAHSNTIGVQLATPTPTLESTPDGIPRTAQVPILMYHYLSEPPPGADAYRLDLSVTPDRFAEHLDRIQTEGYTAISLYQLLANLTHGAPLPAKPVVLTFDDGYRDSYTNAFPLLKTYGMTATFFVITDFMDEARPEYLTWNMAREMLSGGMAIESHGRNHVSLRGKDDDYLVWQALGSRETIEFELGVMPRFISYPGGEYDQQTIDIFQSANYWAGFTTMQGATHDNQELFELRRVRIRGTTTADDLVRLLELDW